jgi:uncharacterized protein YlxP (DUF503 family)
MFVLALEVEAHLPHARSLKDKRQVLRSILDTAQSRFAVAAAELNHQDKWQRTTLGFATVSGSASHAADVIDEVERLVWSQTGLEVVRAERTWLEPG